MTAEVIVMNRKGVALAADSAATSFSPNGTIKIYNTENKLFRISKKSHIGILTYNNLALNYAPFELLVKDFRHKNKDKSWNTVKECKDAFFDYLKQDEFTKISTDIFLINRSIQILTNQLYEFSQQDPSNPTDNQIIAYIDKMLNAASTLSNCSDIDDSLFNRVQEKWGLNIIDNIRSNVLTPQMTTNLKKIDPTEIEHNSDILNKLRDICIYYTYKALTHNDYTGIAFAGFGESEYYPSCIHMNVYGVLCNQVIYTNEEEISISVEKPMAIIPLAQTENVDTFIFGISPTMQNAIESNIENICSPTLIELLQNEINCGRITISNPDAINSIAKLYSANISRTINTIIRNTGFGNLDNIYSALNVLPIPELAQMAKSLVELTSLKKKISMEPDTVGGPIDVAVISKGDGFIWINRKHYFKKDLNEHFFVEYGER